MNRTLTATHRVALRAAEGKLVTRAQRPLLPFSLPTVGPVVPACARAATTAAAAAEPAKVNAPPADLSSTLEPEISAERDHVEGEGQEYARRVLREAVAADTLRHDWTRKEIAAIYYQPPLELAYQAVSPKNHH